MSTLRNNKNNLKVSIIGLGYVGLPLAIEFSKKLNVVAFDVDRKRIKQLKSNYDKNNEVSKSEILKIRKNALFTFNIKDIKSCNYYIITVPTPIKKNKNPDLSYLKSATRFVAKYLKKNDVVVYESTTYPGCTEEICIPILEKISKLKIIKDFSCCYSPERINPGDKKKTLKNINKLVSSTDKKGLKKITYLYRKILKSKLIKVDTIKIAEGAKIIENTQRDINVALINELLILFNSMNINFNSVLKAANTKWNFLNFKPGLVGGHCIGVDPYYLAYKSKKIGFNPKIILSGRKINDGMASYLVNAFVNKIKNNYKSIINKKILVMGLTFKENVKDIRNSKSFDIINLLIKKGFNVDCYDKNVLTEDIKKNRNIKLINKLKQNYYNGILILVPHKHIINIGKKNIDKLIKDNGVILDFKNIFKSKNYQLYK